MVENNKILKREEVALEDTWALEDIFPSNDAWFDEYNSLKGLMTEIESFSGKLSENAETLEKFLKLTESTEMRFSRLINYAFRRSDENTANSYYLDMKGKAMALNVEYSAASAFAVPEINEISDETIDKFIAKNPALKIYKRLLYKIRRRRKHTLSAAEEKLLAAAGEISESPDNIFTAFSCADLKFPDAVDSNGNKHTLTSGTYIPLVESNDRVLRESAFKTLYHTYDAYKNTSAALLDAQTKQLMFFANARKYDSTLSASLDENEVPTSVYHSLIKSVNDGLGSMHRYTKLRKKLMGLDELHMYDLYTSIIADYEENIPYDEAVNTIIEGLAPLGAKYGEILRKGFDDRWVDKYENEGKISGAYSAGCNPHPFVLMNYKNTLDSQFTLAHEMGHALHSYLSFENQPEVYADYVIFVAEVASTCHEILLMRHLISKTDDKRKKAYLINHFLEQFRTTLFRQTMFAEFELEFNKRAEIGESLTAELLSDIYYKLNEKYYGPDIVVDREIAMEWARIPHFFYNFYVFQYSTGFAAAAALSVKILTEGESAVEKYLEFLSSGGSQDPITLLKLAGIDMSTPKPVEDAIKLFDSLIDELDKLLA